ncbi:MAG: hypothetical protein F7C81_00385, partial [Desulfurococcales archaeon]|nr:hypothetical protein [Desulfurococcales archaeon]
MGPGGFEPPTARLSAGPNYQADALDGLGDKVSGEVLSHQLTTGGNSRLPGDTLGLEAGQVNSPCLTVTTELLAGFREWLLEEQGTSEGTVRKYMYYLPKLEGITLCSKSDASRVFQLMGLNKTSYEAFSRLLTYIEKKTSYEELALSLRRALPRKPKSREDTYVPPDSLVKQMPSCLESYGEAYTLLHYILSYSGLRFEEALAILSQARQLRAVDLPYGAVRIHLDMLRGSKRAYVAYLPSRLWDRLQGYSGPIHNEHTFKRRFRGCGLAVKYYRKWWRQKAKELGVDSETIEAFQGRPTTIGGRHYTDWLPILDKEYRHIM